MVRKWWWAVLALLAVIAVVAGVWIWRQRADRQQAQVLRAAMVQQDDMVVAVLASGSVEPARSADLVFGTPGRVAEVLVEMGDRVQAGQALVQLQTGDLERAVEQAELTLRQAQLRLEQLEQPADEADVRRAQNAVDQAGAALQAAQINRRSVTDSPLLNETLEDAQQVFDDAQNRYNDRLAEYERGEIDYWFVDQAQQRLDNARRNLERLQNQADLQSQNAANEVTRASQAYQEAVDNLERLQSGPTDLELEAAQVDVDTATLALENARAALESATLEAPFDGTVARVNVEAGESVPGALPAVVLVDNSTYYVSIGVDEIDVVRIRAGAPVEITFDGLPDVVLEGTVESVAPSADVAGGVVSYPVRIAVATEAEALRAGLTATARIIVDRVEGVLVIPNWAVRVDRETGQTYVERRSEGQVEPVDVTLGVRDETQSQVLSGLEPGDEVVQTDSNSNGPFGAGAGF